METNPYIPPKSLLLQKQQTKRSIWWKLYFYTITLFGLIGSISISFDPNVSLIDYVYNVLFVFGTIGLFGFVYNKKIFNPKFWLYFVIIYIISSIAYELITDINLQAGMSNNVYYLTIAFSWLFSLPAYYGLYCYSKQ